MAMEIMGNGCTGDLEDSWFAIPIRRTNERDIYFLIMISALHRPNSLEMGDRGAWGPGAPPGGWGGPPRSQVQQVSLFLPRKMVLKLCHSELHVDHHRCGSLTKSRTLELVMVVQGA